MTSPMINNSTGRAVPEWIGKSPDSKVPDRVKLRIFTRHNGRCHISGRQIRPGDKWDVEHVIALSLGGENRESNLAPALVASHKIKTAQDRKVKAKDDRIRKRSIGLRKQRTITRWRRFNGEVVVASRER